MSSYGERILTGREGRNAPLYGTLALLLGGAAALLSAISVVMAEPRLSSQGDLVFEESRVFESNGRDDVRKAVSEFVTGMTDHDIETVWMYASEEDQAAFGTEKAVYEAFADVLPPLADAEQVYFERGWQEGDTPFVEFLVTDRGGDFHNATMGLWLDDAGDWKIVSAEVTPAADYIASR